VDQTFAASFGASAKAILLVNWVRMKAIGLAMINWIDLTDSHCLVGASRVEVNGTTSVNGKALSVALSRTNGR